MAAVTGPSAAESNAHGDEAVYTINGGPNDGRIVKGSLLIDPTTSLPYAASGGGGAAGPLVALSSPPAALTASGDTAFTFASQAKHFFLENKSATDAYYDLDTAASPGSFYLPAGGVRGLDVPCTVLHLYSTAATAVNGTAAGNIVLRGWS